MLDEEAGIAPAITALARGCAVDALESDLTLAPDTARLEAAVALTPRLAARLLDLLQVLHGGSAPAYPAHAQPLTRQERDVLWLVSRHASCSVIAITLGITEETVRWRLARTLDRLGWRTRHDGPEQQHASVLRRPPPGGLVAHAYAVPDDASGLPPVSVVSPITIDPSE